jgi:hypothetical protein
MPATLASRAFFGSVRQRDTTDLDDRPPTAVRNLAITPFPFTCIARFHHVLAPAVGAEFGLGQA